MHKELFHVRKYSPPFHKAKEADNVLFLTCCQAAGVNRIYVLIA